MLIHLTELDVEFNENSNQNDSKISEIISEYSNDFYYIDCEYDDIQLNPIFVEDQIRTCITKLIKEEHSINDDNWQLCSFRFEPVADYEVDG